MPVTLTLREVAAACGGEVVGNASVLSKQSTTVGRQLAISMTVIRIQSLQHVVQDVTTVHANVKIKTASMSRQTMCRTDSPFGNSSVTSAIEGCTVAISSV